MKSFEIETADYKRIFDGETGEEAVVACFKEDAPEDVSMFTKFRELPGGHWLYIDTVKMLRLAGYEVQLKDEH